MTTDHPTSAPDPASMPTATAAGAPTRTASPLPRPSRRALLGAAVPAGLAVAATGALAGPRPEGLGARTGDAGLADSLAPHLGGHRHVAAALIDGDGPVFAGFGADQHREFEIGSATKTFTAALVMDAVSHKKLTLDTTVGQILGTAAQGSAIERTTVRALASHTSGLPRLPQSSLAASMGSVFLRGNPYAGITAADLQHDALQAKLSGVGSYEYSNLGVALEGLLAAHALGGEYAPLVTERILRPLGMGATRIPASAAALGAHPTRGRDESGRSVAPWPMDGYAPAGGIRSTAADMAVYLRSMMDGSNPGARGVQPTATVRAGSRVGVNWFTTETAAGPVVWHNGMTGGFASFIGWSPTKKRGVVLLTDTALSVDELALKVLTGEVAR